MEQLGAENVMRQETPEEMLKVAEAITIALGGKDLKKKKETDGS